MMFNIWSPATIATDEIAFDVTRANMPRVGSGDPEWIAVCLKTIGVPTAARSWSIHAARCYFYSDYADEPDWRDRWPDTWTVQVKLAGAAPEGFGPSEALPKQMDQYDRTWKHDEVDPAHGRTALLIPLIRGSKKDAIGVRNRLLALLPAEIGVATTRLDQAGPDWVRLRIVVTGALFPERVEALEEFLLRCRQQQLIVNHNEME